MHVLKRVHRWLRPRARLLDIHPEPEAPSIEIATGTRVVPVGPFHRPALDDKIRAARAALDTLVDEGLFVRERSAVVEIVSHHANVDAWMEYRARRPGTSPVDPELLKRGRDLQRRLRGGELLVREHIRATRYGRRAYRWPAPA